MPNEFVARNGVIALDNSTITGSLIVSNGITGSLFGSASYALTASFALNASTAAGDKITTGSITASVNLGAATFQLISGSSTFLYVSSSGNVGIGTTTPTTKLYVSSSSTAAYLRGSGSAVFAIDGNAGRLFSVDDSLSGSLYSVNTIAGLPIMEIFSDNTVRIGQYGQKALYVSQSNVGIGTETPTAKLHITGSTGAVLEIDGISTANNALYVSASGNVGIRTGTPTSASLHISGNVFADSYTGSLLGTASVSISSSFATSASVSISSSFATSASVSISSSFALTASYAANAASSYVSFNRQTANYTLAITDLDKIVEINSASANTVTVPSSSVVNFLTGSQITVVQYGAGQTSFTTASVGVIVRSANNWLKINARYGAATLTKIGGDEWYLQGNLNA